MRIRERKKRLGDVEKRKKRGEKRGDLKKRNRKREM